MCAPSEKYLRMSGPLSLGLGVVLMANLGEYHYIRKITFDKSYSNELKIYRTEYHSNISCTPSFMDLQIVVCHQYL